MLRNLKLALLLGFAILETRATAQTKPDLSQAPASPQVQFDPSGAIHSGPQTIAFPPLASDASREAYRWLLRYAEEGQPSDPQEFASWFGNHVPALFAREKSIALKAYPVTEDNQKIAGVDVTVY